MNENKSGLCTASLVLGIICLVTSFIFNLGFLPGVLGLIFGIICLAKKKQPKGRAKGGLITSIIGLVIGFFTGIIGVILIVFSGLVVGGGIAGLSALGKTIQSGDLNQVVNVIDNIQDISSATNSGSDGIDINDLLNSYSNDYDYDLDNQFTINENGGFDINEPMWDGDGYDYSGDFDWDSYLNDYDWEDYTSNDFSGFNSGSHSMTLEDTYFEDLEDYGFKYSYGDVDYNVYTNSNGAQIEFPAYVFADYKKFGSTKMDAYKTILASIDSNDLGYYDSELYDDIKGVDEWEYAYFEFYNEYDEYQIEVVAFNKYNNNMVCLILRPSDNAPSGSNFDEDFNDFMGTMKYMHSVN